MFSKVGYMIFVHSNFDSLSWQTLYTHQRTKTQYVSDDLKIFSKIGFIVILYNNFHSFLLIDICIHLYISKDQTSAYTKWPRCFFWKTKGCCGHLISSIEWFYSQSCWVCVPMSTWGDDEHGAQADRIQSRLYSSIADACKELRSKLSFENLTARDSQKNSSTFFFLTRSLACKLQLWAVTCKPKI